MKAQLRRLMMNGFVFLSIYLFQRGVAEICIPDCSGRVEGDKTRDPTNCLRYYYCSDPEGQGILIPSDEPLTCPDGQYFNSAIEVSACEEIVPGQDYCIGLCNPCKPECKLPGTLIPNPSNCKSFFICLDDLSTIEDFCPESLPYFDPVSQFCTNDPSICNTLCDICEVYCTEAGKIPNPNDCHGYFYCNPPEIAGFTCPNNEVFDPNALRCDNSTTTCTNAC